MSERNSPDDVPDESSFGSLSAAFWALVILGGLALFVWDFGTATLKSLESVGYPIDFINNLKLTLFTLEMLFGGATVAIIGYVLFRYASPNREAPKQLTPGEGKYTLTLYAIGILFLMAMSIFMGASTLAQTDEASTPQEHVDTGRSIDVEVVGAQWVWRFDDGEQGVPYVQSEKFVVPSHTLVNLRITSGDVVHSFAIQELGIKKDAIPGQVNSASFMVEEVEGETTISAGGQTFQADTYQINCAELCGAGHSKMVANLVVITPEDYQTWVEAHGGTVPESFHEEESEDGGHGHGGDESGDEHDESEDGHSESENGHNESENGH